MKGRIDKKDNHSGKDSLSDTGKFARFTFGRGYIPPKNQSIEAPTGSKKVHSALKYMPDGPYGTEGLPYYEIENPGKEKSKVNLRSKRKSSPSDKQPERLNGPKVESKNEPEAGKADNKKVKPWKWSEELQPNPLIANSIYSKGQQLARRFPLEGGPQQTQQTRPKK